MFLQNKILEESLSKGEARKDNLHLTCTDQRTNKCPAQAEPKAKLVFGNRRTLIMFNCSMTCQHSHITHIHVRKNGASQKAADRKMNERHSSTREEPKSPLAKTGQ